MTRLYFLIRFNALLLLLLAWSGSGLYAQITASFSISPSQGCAPQVVNFTSTCTGTITGYSWSFGNGTSVSHLQNPSTTYTSTGTYTITLTVTGSGGPKTATGSVTIYASPTVSLSFTPSAGCNPLSVSFSSVISPGVSGSVTQLWDFQDGVTSSSSNPSHNYTTSGTYYPVLSVTNSKGCTGTYISTNAVTVYPKPSVSFSAYPRGFCTPSGLVNFTGSVGSGSSPYTYSWDYGDGGGYSPGSLSSSHNYYTVGSFTVKLKVTDAKGCTDSSVQTNFVTTHQNLASFSGPTTACVSTPFGPPPQTYSSNTFFKNTTPGFTASSTYWDFGDLSNAYGDSLGHAYTTPGTYTIKMVTQVGPCADTATKTITINPRPATNVTWTPDPNCPAPVTINFTATGGKNYSWSWSSGGTATGATASKYYPIDPLKDTLLLITLDSNGCSDTVQRVVTIHNIKIQVLNPYKGCVPFTYKPQVLLLDYVSGNGLYPYPTPKSVHWDFGDGDTSNSDTPTHVYITPGIYKRVVTITTVNGCTQTDTSNVYVGDKFKPSFTFMPDTVCPKVQVYFTNTSGRPPTQNFTYLWDVGVAVSYVNSVDAIAIYSVPGIYNIILYADSNGCIDSTMCSGCMVVLPANADFTDSIPCPPNNLTAIFINSSVGATSNHWSFGDGTNSTLANPTHIYADTGVYVAQLITTNNIYGCTDTMAISIRLSNPQIDFHATDTTLCEQDTLHLIPTATGSATLNRCIWTVDSLTHLLDTFGHGQIFVMRPFSLVYPLGLKTPIVGYHDVQLIAVFQTSGQHQCLDTVIKRKYFIVSHPIPDFKVSSQIGCTPFPAVFSDSTKYTPGTQRDTLLWQFGDGSSTASLASSIMHVYAKDGVFNVKLVAKDWNGCKDSIFKPAYVQSRKPNAFYQVKSLNACIGQQIFFSNLSVGSTGLFTNWSFGDGDTAATFHGTHAYKAVGSYTARMVVFDSTGCSDTMIKVITVTKPTAAFSLNDTLAICPPLIVKFTSTSTNAVAYTWDFKNTGSAAIANPSSTFSAPGVYNVQLIVTDAAGCTDTARHNVRVLGYAGAFDYPIKSGCVPLTVNFTSNIVGIPTITWDFADGTTEIGVGFSATHTYLYPGVYVPKLIFSDGGTGCKASSVGLDTIKVDAVIAGFEALPPCEKTQIQLIDTSFSYFSAMKAWKWNFGNSGAATGNPVNRTYANAGKYPVTLIATNAQGCSDTLADSITIYPLPLVVAMPDTSICVPDALYLTVEGAKTYFWQPPNDLSCTNCASPRANPNTAISYIVTGTDAHGCANKDTVNIGMQTKATFKTNGDGTICLGDKIQLFAAGATLYDWTPPESLDSPKSAHPLASPKVNTTYIVTGREGSCLADTHLVHIVVRPLPTVNAGSDVKVIAGKTTILQASGSGISGVLWSGDSSLSCYTCFAPEAKPRKTTTYYVKAYNEFGCTSTDSVTVFVLCDGSQLFIPNTFSPNGDGYNDRFFPRGDGIKLITSFRIYSRWGELMYERKNMEVNDESAGWDGIHNGRILTPDVFVYVIEANCESGAPLMFKGDVTLLK